MNLAAIAKARPAQLTFTRSNTRGVSGGGNVPARSPARIQRKISMAGPMANKAGGQRILALFLTITTIGGALFFAFS